MLFLIVYVCTCNYCNNYSFLILYKTIHASNKSVITKELFHNSNPYLLSLFSPFLIPTNPFHNKYSFHVSLLSAKISPHSKTHNRHLGSKKTTYVLKSNPCIRSRNDTEYADTPLTKATHRSSVPVQTYSNLNPLFPLIMLSIEGLL